MTTIPETIGPGITQIGPDDGNKLKKDRLKRQECPTCGIKLFKIPGNQLLANTPKEKRTPFLCKTGRTVSGRCLVCHPLEVEEQDEPSSCPPKYIIGDDASDVSSITLDRRLMREIDDSRRNEEAASQTTGRMSRPSKSSYYMDDDLGSFDSENDDDDAGSPKKKSPQHRSVRSMTNSSHHNAVSLSSSARNRWGESEHGADADLSTGPRPMPPKRVPSNDGNKSQHQQQQHQQLGQNTSLHHSLQSRDTITTACNTTEESPNYRPISPNQRTGNNPGNRVPRIIIPHSPTKKSNFVPPWNPKTQNSSEHSNARKPGDQIVNEIFFTSDERRDVTSRLPPSEPLGKEITLFGKGYSGPSVIPMLDEKPRFTFNRRNSTGVDFKSRQPQEIHVDLSLHGDRQKMHAPPKDLKTRPGQLHRELIGNGNMEKIHNQLDGANRPPKSVFRATSVCTEEPYVDDEFRSKIRGMDMIHLLAITVSEEIPEKKIIVLDYMTDTIWSNLDKSSACQQFSAEQGMEVLTSAMYSEMKHIHVQIALLKFIFALASKPCDYIGKDVPPLFSNGSDVVIDAILISMKQHALNDKMQLLGCQVLCCISSGMSIAADINDGTRSGACLAVLNAMEAHRDHVAIQEWGMRTLFNHCALSRHAEANKRLILSAELLYYHDVTGQPVTGGDVLYRVLKMSSKTAHAFLLEWSCKVYKELTRTPDILYLLSPASDLLKSLLNIVHRGNLARTEVTSIESKGIIEVSLYIISRLLNVDSNKFGTDIVDIFLLMLDTINMKMDCLEIVQLCFAILSKLSSEDALRKEDLEMERLVRRILKALMMYSEVTSLQELGMRTLACLCIGSDPMKECLAKQENLADILGLFFTNFDASDASLLRDHTCTLVAALLSSKVYQDQALQCNVLEALTMIMTNSKNNVKLQEVAVTALMNLANSSNSHLFVEHGMIELVVSAMEWNASSVAIQMYGCSTLWNVGVKAKDGIHSILTTCALKYISLAIQNHCENEHIVDVACACLWGLCDISDECKNQILLIERSLEGIASTLVTPLQYPSVQKKACGVLVSVSCAINETNARSASLCVSHITDAVRRNANCYSVLQACACFLRSVLSHAPEHCNEVCDVIPIFVAVLMEDIDGKEFEQDVGMLIKVISDRSEDAKNQLLQMDNITQLMEKYTTSKAT